MAQVAFKTPIPLSWENTCSEQISLRKFLSQLRFPQWVLLIYPIIQTLLSRQRSADAAYIIDTSAWMQILFTGFVGIVMLIRFLRTGSSLKKKLFHRPAIWFTLYCLTAILSSLWSERPDYTFYRGCEVFIYLLVVVDAVRVSTSPGMALRFMLLIGMVVVMVGEFSVLANNFSLGALHNSLVPGAIVPMIFVGWTISRGLWRWIYYTLFGAIILATSAATYLSLLAGVGMVFLLAKKNKVVGILGLSFILVALSLWNFDVGEYVFWGKSEHQIRSATGRLPVWQWILEEKVPERPLLGFAFGTGELLARLYNIHAGRLRMMHMHNVVMSALVNMGLLGLGLFLLMLMELFKGLWAIRRLPDVNLFAAGTIAMILNGMSISSFTAFLSLGWICHMLFIMTLFYIVSFTRPYR